MRKFNVRWFRTHDMLVSKQLPKFMSPWQWRMDLDDVVWREVSEFFKSLEEQQK